MKVLLRLFPLKTLLLGVATLILDRKSDIVKAVLDWINYADRTFIPGQGANKFQWVKAKLMPLLKSGSSVWVDTAIQALVAYTRAKAGAVPPELPAATDGSTSAV